MKRFWALLAALLVCICAPVLGESAQIPDGIYRGSYYEGGIEQIAIEFELCEGVFTSIVYRGVRYKDGDYMNKDASDAQKATLRQYRQLADYLIGKGVDAIDTLYMPYEIVDDLDAVTSATMQSSKLISALWDGIGRRPFALLDSTVLMPVGNYSDGLYRGTYYEDGIEQVAVEFSVRGGAFAGVDLLTLAGKGADYLAPENREEERIAGQVRLWCDSLEGKPLSSINDLYAEDTVDCNPCVSKLISALWDGLNRRAVRVD